MSITLGIFIGICVMLIIWLAIVLKVFYDRGEVIRLYERNYDFMVCAIDQARAMLEVKSYPEQREVVPVEVDMVLEDWKKMGLPVEPEVYIELSEHEFHGGTCFPGIILLDKGNAQELRERMAEGYQPTFWLSERTSAGKEVGK